MAWQVRTHCEHGWCDGDQEQADAVLATAPLIGRPFWLMSYPPQLMATVASEAAATALVEALATVPHIGIPTVVVAPSEQHAESRPAVAENQRDDG